VLVGHFLRNSRSWEGSSEKLIEFWNGLMSPAMADILIQKNPFIRNWWNYMHFFDPNIADAETARRFWSIFQFAFTLSGVPNMYVSVPTWNYKFFNPFTDYLPWWRYDYKPLRRYLSRFVDFPIKTSFDRGEPRLLLVGLDVQDYTTAVVFDSYEKLHQPKEVKHSVNENWYSEYGQGQVGKHVVFYDGIGLEQVLASTLGKYAIDQPCMDDRISGTRRLFWDGGYHSNTPLRQLILDHRKYWYEYLKRKGNNKEGEQLTKLPDLEVYIVNLHPSVLTNIPKQKDLIDNTEQDIVFHDRTNFDEHLAYLISDYVDLANELIELAKLHGLTEDVKMILKKAAKGFSRSRGESKKYKDIIEGRIDITRVWRIDRSEDPNDIFGKSTDFSPTSIAGLIRDGMNDAKLSINWMEIQFTVQDLMDEGILFQQEGKQMIRKTMHIPAWSRLSFRDKETVVNSLRKFISLVNDQKAAGKLTLGQWNRLVNPANTIINEIIARIDE
jgi:NTE family protein